MLRRIFLLLPLLALAACSSGQTQTPSAQPTTPAPAATETSAPVAVAGNTVGCTVESPRPTPGPTEQSVFPFPGPSDWVKGPESAAITVFEYSDFQ
jgi:hypothetical protein